MSSRSTRHRANHEVTVAGSAARLIRRIAATRPPSRRANDTEVPPPPEPSCVPTVTVLPVPASPPWGGEDRRPAAIVVTGHSAAPRAARPAEAGSVTRVAAATRNATGLRACKRLLLLEVARNAAEALGA